ncbi:hypothetical protein AAFF_G00265850 [Aldrovandia affinis]|uniref:Uncharacterized protein n=1 Tax=Aldrovandia affinis TaxID=143900 RepID=A0AAD7RBD9_9TELE|nr:hypothetical protein AAFF_G00265850 [Aldrovandia affinis]
MKKFFGAHREEDYGQVRYLTAKCSRLAQEKAVLEREYVVAGERERTLRKDLEALSRQLCQQEQLNMDLRVTHEQLLSQLCREKELVQFLQQKLRRAVEEGSRDTGLLGLQLEQLCVELQKLQGSEAQLECLMEELHRESLSRAAQADILNAQFHSGMQELETLRTCHQETVMELEALRSSHQEMALELAVLRRSHQETASELETLQTSHQETVLELQTLQSYHLQTVFELEVLQTSHQERELEFEALRGSHQETVQELEQLQTSHQERELEFEQLQSLHQGTVQELRRENEGSLRKLQEMAEQFEWLCEQQRSWVCYVKRFKDSVSEEKGALLEQMGRMEKELAMLRKNSEHEGQDEASSSTATETETENCRLSDWDARVKADLQTEVEKWRCLYEDLYVKLARHQEEGAEDGPRKPP